jgi:uncharacterized membrane protein
VSTLTVWSFEGPGAAEEALPGIRRLAEQHLIAVADAALASWPAGQSKPSVRGLGGLTRPGALWGGFWGVLLGLVFLAPIAGPVFGAGAGAVACLLADFGLEDDVVKRVRDLVTPGRSALFVVSEDAAADAIAAALAPPAAGTLRFALTEEQSRRLFDVLGEEIERPVAP